jgi:hypothetical protein
MEFNMEIKNVASKTKAYYGNKKRNKQENRIEQAMVSIWK